MFLSLTAWQLTIFFFFLFFSGKGTKRKAESQKQAKTTKKAKKDDGAPKRPKSAYLIFSTEKREEIKANNPGIAFGDIAKEASKMWSSLSETDKKVRKWFFSSLWYLLFLFLLSLIFAIFFFFPALQR